MAALLARLTAVCTAGWAAAQNATISIQNVCTNPEDAAHKLLGTAICAAAAEASVSDRVASAINWN